MNTLKRAIAAAELLLIFPALLFMSAIFLRSIQPIQYEPAHTAQQIVNWYAARTHIGLWLFLIALPLTVVVTGCAVLVRSWNSSAQLRHAARQTLAAVRMHLPTAFVAATTLVAAGILAIVAFHMLTN